MEVRSQSNIPSGPWLIVNCANQYNGFNDRNSLQTLLYFTLEAFQNLQTHQPALRHVNHHPWCIWFTISLCCTSTLGPSHSFQDEPEHMLHVSDSIENWIKILKKCKMVLFWSPDQNHRNMGAFFKKLDYKLTKTGHFQNLSIALQYNSIILLFKSWDTFTWT